jgi:hypothetical protein
MEGADCEMAQSLVRGAASGGCVDESKSMHLIFSSLVKTLTLLEDDAEPVQIHLDPNADGSICLTDHKLQLGSVGIELPDKYEKYGGRGKKANWRSLIWSTRMHVNGNGKVLLLRMKGVQQGQYCIEFLTRTSYI